MYARALLAALLLAAAGLLASPAAFAQGVDDARIDRLLQVMRARETVDGLLPQLEASQRQMIDQLTAGEPVDDARRARMDAVLARTNQRVRESLAWENMAPVYRDIYRSTFSGEDIDAMLAFYESPAGQRLLDKMPLLMQNTMAAVQRMVVPLLQQLEQELRAEASAGG